MTALSRPPSFLRTTASRLVGNLSGSDGRAQEYDSAAVLAWLGISGGSGDVVGPASATDDALVRFDGTTGKLVQDSTVTVSDGGNIVTAGHIQSTNSLRVYSGASLQALADHYEFRVPRNGYFRWAGNTWNTDGGISAALYCDDTAIIHQRNGTAAQTWRLANTFTSTTDFESLQFKASSTEYQIGSAIGSAGGTGRDAHLGYWNSAGSFTPVVGVDVSQSCMSVTRQKTAGNKFLRLIDTSGNEYWSVEHQTSTAGFYRTRLRVQNNLYVSYQSTDIFVVASTHLSMLAPIISTSSASFTGAISGGDLSASGDVTLSALPTTDPVVAGQLWNDSGTVKVSAG